MNMFKVFGKHADKSPVPANIFSVCIAFFFLLLATSCASTKDFSYFQDLSDTSKVYNIQLYPYQALKLEANDQLQITISSQSPEASQFFNLMTSTVTSGIAGISSDKSFQNIYTIDQSGNVVMPVLGEIKCVGFTTEEVRLALRDKLKDYLVDPIVTLRLTNFKVTVIGEVGRPTIVPVDGERINILQALGAAGDLGPFAKRYNVRVMRNVNDTMRIASLDFGKSQLLSSPYFQLKQNDVIYVEPTKARALRSDELAFWMPIIISAVTAISLAISRIF